VNPIIQSDEDSPESDFNQRLGFYGPILEVNLDILKIYSIDREFVTCTEKIRKNALSGDGVSTKYIFGLLIYAC